MKPLLDELEREVEARRRTYPGQVAKMRLSEAEARHRAAVLEAILADVCRAAAGDCTYRPGAIPWSAKLAELERELGDRRRFYPGWIAKGRIDQATADRQIAALEAVHDLYWRQMLAWDPPAGSACCWNPDDPRYDTDAARLYRQAVRDHTARVEIESAPAPKLFEEA